MPNETYIAIGRVSEFAQFASPTKHDLTIVRGDSLSVVFRCYREVSACGDASGVQTLTGLQGRATLRAAQDHPVTYPLTVTVDTDAGSGRVTISASAALTLTLPDLGVYDIELNDGTDDLRKTIVRGAFKLMRDASY